MTDEELKQHARTYKRISNQVKNLSQDQGILRRRILDEMAARQTQDLKLGNIRIVVREVTQQRIDTGKLWDEAPAVAEVYAVTSVVQRLAVS